VLKKRNQNQSQFLLTGTVCGGRKRITSNGQSRGKPRISASWTVVESSGKGLLLHNCLPRNQLGVEVTLHGFRITLTQSVCLISGLLSTSQKQQRNCMRSSLKLSDGKSLKSTRNNTCWSPLFSKERNFFFFFFFFFFPGPFYLPRRTQGTNSQN